MAEYGSTGIWLEGTVGPFRHGMMTFSKLKLPAELSTRFQLWIATYEQRLVEKMDVDSFNATGQELAMLLKVHVQEKFDVVFVPENPDGSCGQDQVIES